MSLLPLAEAQAQLLALAPAMQVERVATEAALGRVLAEPLTARRTQPAANLSAMDGYALCGAGPWTLVGESRAGAPYEGTLSGHQATRISTGAHMPDGSDRVLMQENAAVEGDRLSVAAGESEPSAGKHVRKAGFDFVDGDVLLPAGSPIGPAQIALALSAGIGSVSVAKPPRVAVLDSGDELAHDPESCAAHQIPASNGAMLAAMVRPLVGDVQRIGPVADDLGTLAQALRAAEGADVLITSGGASVGDHDLVQRALADWGADLAFWRVAIKPGKPLMVATRGGQVVLGLPGNPVSSYVTALLFALPLIRRAMGVADALPQMLAMRAGEDMPAGGSRYELLRGIAQDGRVGLADSQDSSGLRSLASANVLIERPVDAPGVAAGDTLRVLPIAVNA